MLICDDTQESIRFYTEVLGFTVTGRMDDVGKSGWASLNQGAEHAMAQAQHGSAPDIAGQGIANPVSIIGSAAMLLDWFSQRGKDPKYAQAAAAINRALEQTLADAANRTPDLGGNAGTDDFASAVAASIGTAAE